MSRDLQSLFLAHKRELHAFLTDKLSDPDAANDLTQETFLRYAERGTTVAVIHQRSYLYRTALNLAIDYVRTKVRRRTESMPHEDMASFEDACPGIEADYSARQRLQMMQEAIDELPERTREIFILQRIDGLTYAEVADQLGISTSSVQKHLATALQHVMQRADHRK